MNVDTPINLIALYDFLLLLLLLLLLLVPLQTQGVKTVTIVNRSPDKVPTHPPSS